MKKELAISIMISVFLLAGCTNEATNSDLGQESTTVESTSLTTETTSTAVEEVENKTLYNSDNIAIKLLGAESFTELKSDKMFVDKTENGFEYLTVYLEIENRSINDDYFNYNFLKSYVDGNEVETAVLMNKPKKYSSILTSLQAETTTQGYLVYEVPVGWQNLEIRYTGWEQEGGQVFLCEFTPDDLKEVDEYVNMNIQP